MQSWLALLKKEFLLTRVIYFLGIGLIFLVLAISYAMQEGYLASTTTDTVMLIGMTGGVLLHFIYLPIYMIISMQKELGTFQLWLHSPQPMYRLILAKMTSGLLCMISSLLLNGIIVLLLIFQLMSPEAAPSIWETIKFSGLGGSFIVVQSLYLGLCVLFFLSLYLVLRKALRKWSWVVVIGLFIGLSWMSDKVTDMTWYYTLTEWGAISIEFQTGVLQPMSHAIGEHQLYFGSMLVHLIIMIIIFVISTVLIDRKVEV